MPLSNLDKRRSKRISKNHQEKRMLALWNQLQRLLKAKRNFNLVELEKPERSGWVRYFVLREDIQKSREAPFFFELLVHLNNESYCRDRDFHVKSRKLKKKIPLFQKISTISVKKWNELKLTDKQKKFFERKYRSINDKKGKKIGGEFYYEFSKPWMFEFKIEPHYITHRIVLNPELESELKRVYNKIERNNLEPKVARLMGWSSYLDDWDDFRNKIVGRMNDEELLKFKKEKLS